MESKPLDSVLKTTVTGNQVNEMPAGDSRKKTEDGYERKEAGLKRDYDAISKNGDTLELSEKGKKLGRYMDKDGEAFSGKKIADNILAGCSGAKLKQLYANKEITRQQYERIIKMKKVK